MPVSGRVKVPLTIEAIYKKISDYDIYRYYIGHDFEMGRTFSSPMRKENNPSFSIIRKENGKFHHFDYGWSEHSGDAIDFVCQMFILTPSQALMKIDHDFGLGITPGTQKTNEYKSILSEHAKNKSRRHPKKIVVITRRMDFQELGYWNSYHISESELKLNNVFGVKTIFLDGTRVSIRATDLVFAYKFGLTWKIYFPYRPREEKWLGNTSFEVMSGIETIKPGSSLVVVTKAKKDEMVLRKFLPNVCSVQGESSYAINQTNLGLLMTCPNRVINFDSDETGVLSSKYFNQFGFGWINAPKGLKGPKGEKCKDFADIARYFGMEMVMAYFKRKGLLT